MMACRVSHSVATLLLARHLFNCSITVHARKYRNIVWKILEVGLCYAAVTFFPILLLFNDRLEQRELGNYKTIFTKFQGW